MVRIDASVTGWLMKMGREINAVLGDLSPADLPNQAINWDDLGCHDVTLRWDGERLVIRAVIEEAAPSWVGRRFCFPGKHQRVNCWFPCAW
jgi:hypothetical protein